MKKPIKQWLETIADKEIREAAISQIDEGSVDIQVNSLLKALGGFNLWINTKEGWKYWNNVFIEVENGTLETREVEATELEKPFSSWYGEEKLGFSYDMDKLTPEYKEDGTIILKPKKKEKVWIEVYFSAIDHSICTTEHLSKEELKESIEVGKEDGDTLLEVIEREYEIENQ